MTIREKVARAPHPLTLSHSSTTAVINAFLEAAAEKGWHMRPDEAHGDMLEITDDAAIHQIRKHRRQIDLRWQYRAMLAAAPKFEWDK